MCEDISAVLSTD
uniref:Uncharacterized protein n=1 Tax=Anguilla anguilla TaxID=7936 RepID=A0A0E9T6J6_ANGAN